MGRFPIKHLNYQLKKSEDLACFLERLRLAAPGEWLPLRQAVCSIVYQGLHHPLPSGWHEAMLSSLPKHPLLLIKVFAVKLTHFAHSSICWQLFKTLCLTERYLCSGFLQSPPVWPLPDWELYTNQVPDSPPKQKIHIPPPLQTQTTLAMKPEWGGAGGWE